MQVGLGVLCYSDWFWTSGDTALKEVIFGAGGFCIQTMFNLHNFYLYDLK